MEVVNHTLSIDIDFTITSLDSDLSLRSLSLTIAPSTSLVVELGFTFLSGQSSSEIVDIEAIKLGVILKHVRVGAGGNREVGIVYVFSKLSQVVVHVVTIVGVLLERVEECDFGSFVWRETIEGVVSSTIFVINAVDNISELSIVSLSGIIKSVWLIKKHWSQRFKLLHDFTSPEEIMGVPVLARCSDLLLTADLPERQLLSLIINNKSVEITSNVFKSSLLVDLIEELLSHE